MKRHNVLFYGKDNNILQWQMFNVFCSEHRCFMKDSRAHPWGTSTLDRELSGHPSILKTLYTPVEVVIVTAIDDGYFDQLIDEISLVLPYIKVLVVDPDGKEATIEMQEKYPAISITYGALHNINKVEDLYFYNQEIVLESHNDDNEFWINFFKWSLHEVNIK